MRDVFHVFPDITAAAVSTTYTPADSADFGALEKNLTKFTGHHTGQGPGEVRVVFQLTGGTIAITNIFTLEVQDSPDNSTFTSRLKGATTTVSGAAIPEGTKFTLPLPLTHARYLRPAVTTGTPWASSRVFKTWLEMGHQVL